MKLSDSQNKALAALKKNGRIVASMVGSTRFSYRWQDSNVTENVPKASTIKSLMGRGLLFTKSHRSHPVLGELLLTHCPKDWANNPPLK